MIVGRQQADVKTPLLQPIRMAASKSCVAASERDVGKPFGRPAMAVASRFSPMQPVVTLEQ
jgi:hypothetical protein